MSDMRQATAIAEDWVGQPNLVAITVRESDSEVIPDIEMWLMLQMAIEKAGFRFVEYHGTCYV
jgi:hypothetical protein